MKERRWKMVLLLGCLAVLFLCSAGCAGIPGDLELPAEEYAV